MRKLLLILPIVGLFGLSLGADATQGECQVFNNHSGHVPGSYDYAEFYEDGQLVTTVETDGEDIFVNPEGFDAGSKWDQVRKCNYTTTTTTTIDTTTSSTSQESSTTTTTPEDSTTSTLGTTTTTVLPATTTTAPGSSTTSPLPTFTPRIECRNENVVVDAVWNPSQFLSVDVYLGEPDTTIEAHLILGEEWVTSAVPGQKFTLVGNADGFVQSQIVFAPEGCADDTPPIPSDAPELPFTGIGETVGLLLAAAALLGLGVSTVRASKRIPE